MNGYLLDTDVISMFSPSKAAVSAAFLEWLEVQDRTGALFLSAITVHEIEKGIGLLERKGANAKAASLRLWLSGLVSTYDDRILPASIDVATVSGQLEAAAVAAGHNVGMSDALIAGTAKAHDLTVVTRNLKHFRPFGVTSCAPDDVTPRTR